MKSERRIHRGTFFYFYGNNYCAKKEGDNESNEILCNKGSMKSERRIPLFATYLHLYLFQSFAVYSALHEAPFEGLNGARGG